MLSARPYPRDNRVVALVTKSEMEAIKAKAEASGASLSEYMRLAALRDDAPKAA